MKTLLALALSLIMLSALAQFGTFYADQPFLARDLTAGAGFNPATNSDLVWWIDARSATNIGSLSEGDIPVGFYDGSMNSNATVATGSTVRWRASGAGSNNLPYLTLTNTSGIQWTGTNNVMETNTFTVLTVVRFHTNFPGTPLLTLWEGSAAGANPFSHYEINGLSAAFNGSTSNSIGLQNGANLNSGVHSITGGVWYVLVQVANSTSSLFRTNGVLLKSGTIGTANNWDFPSRFGAGGHASRSTYMDFLRGMVWKRPLTTEEIEVLEAWCAADFGVY